MGKTARKEDTRHAVDGILHMLKGQHNAWIHTTATLIVIIAGVYVQLSIIEWCFIVLAIMAVWVSESLNTAFEILCDVASPEFHPLVEKSKDVAAGAVLLSAVGAVVIGLLVFTPYFVKSV